ncbi:nucleotidyltransferase domain-containing protein [Candidatus Azambacteria bacterium]|nr:nucleotidyltransferase domain-containing protein [Candidatus Azambacteria bacterium]
MGDTRHSILSLLALAHAESLPALSFTDICALLPVSSAKTAAPEEITSVLARLEKEWVVAARDGWYALMKPPDTDEIRRRADISRQKIARNRFFFLLMQAVPFVEAAAITGSVSMENANEKSDIDILCIVKKGRMWTARILLLFLAELFGKRRDHKRYSDKACFNCFASKDASFPFHNIAAAHMLARALPLFGSKPLETFFTTNAWTQEYVSRPTRTPLIPASRALRAVSASTVWLLSGSVGNALERALARWQIDRLRRKVKQGSDASGLVLRDDIVTLYYPDIKNKAVMALYTDTINTLDYEMSDSRRAE